MKHLLTLLLLCVISTTAFSQVGLKGINVGDKVNPLELTYNSPNTYYKKSTLGGIEGEIIALTLNNGTIYRVAFMPNTRIYKTDANHLLSGINTKYSISLTKKHSSAFSEDWIAGTTKDNIQYFIKAENNKYMTPPCEFVFVIISKTLDIIAKQEAQQAANSDF